MSIRRTTLAVLVACALGVGLSGCVTDGLGAAPPSSPNMSSAVTALTLAESNLYDQIIAVSAARQRSTFARAFVLKDRAAADIPGLYSASPPGGYVKAKAIRLKVLGQLGNYAQQVDAIASSGPTAWPSAEANTAVTATGKLATDLFGAAPPSDVTVAVNIVNGLATDIVAAQSATEVQKLASDAEKKIETIQTMIANDNDWLGADAQALASGQQQNEAAILGALYAEPGTARERLQLTQALPTYLPASISIANQQQAVSDAMAKLVGANQALAAKKPQTALELINEAMAIANQINTAIQPTKPAK